MFEDSRDRLKVGIKETLISVVVKIMYTRIDLAEDLRLGRRTCKCT